MLPTAKTRSQRSYFSYGMPSNDFQQSQSREWSYLDEHTEGRERPVAPPVAARRTVARVEHDFSPAIAKQAQELGTVRIIRIKFVAIV